MKSLLRWTWRALLLALCALTVVQFWFLVHIWHWADHNPESTAFMRSRLSIIRSDEPGARLAQRWAPYARISLHLKQAVIAAEDANFMSHWGFDWEAMRRAHERNVKEGEVTAGASTISQQLAKNLFLPSARAWWRKAQEAAITVMLETVLTKRRILEIYLNVAEWGDGVYGAEAAARYHYGVPAAALSPEQAARLAAMLPSPRSYTPRSDTLYLRERTADLLSHMHLARIP
ncbi:MAG TPA: monofunctional biosynthetic peptidoglycan transglycosylase [Burkholderiales bacterium]|nr:monofunctional biosynthetic peptidoglycan transglycosylase [Burkholderiales bacterium]